MSQMDIDLTKLAGFECKLEPNALQSSKYPVRVLGYGEISTVLEIDFGNNLDLAYKRMPLFHTMEETNQYERLYKAYIQILQDQIGIEVVPSKIIHIIPEEKNYVAVYIIQDKLPPESIGHRAIQSLGDEEIFRLFYAVLDKLNQVFDFNRNNGKSVSLGIDGQISNWAVKNYDPQSPKLGEQIELLYLDTSTPLMRKNGKEQLDPELFLRSAPSFLVWILRLFFLDDVLTRYYDFRKVCIDLVANFYKEQRPDLVPDLIEIVNDFLSSQFHGEAFEQITLKEVRNYYREDAWIWRLYLAFRKIDRGLHRLFGKEYPYILPGKIKR